MRSSDFIALAERAGFHYDKCEGLCPHAIVTCNSLVGSLVGLPTGDTEALDRLGEMVKKANKETHNSRRARVWIYNKKSAHYWWFRVCEYQPA